MKTQRNPLKSPKNTVKTQLTLVKLIQRQLIPVKPNEISNTQPRKLGKSEYPIHNPVNRNSILFLLFYFFLTIISVPEFSAQHLKWYGISNVKCSCGWRRFSTKLEVIQLMNYEAKKTLMGTGRLLPLATPRPRDFPCTLRSLGHSLIQFRWKS